MYSIYDGGCNECVHVADIVGSLMAPNYHFRVSDNGRSGVRTGASSSMNQINLKGWVPQWNQFSWWEDGSASADRQERKKKTAYLSAWKNNPLSLCSKCQLCYLVNRRTNRRKSHYTVKINHDKSRGGRWSLCAHTNQTFPTPELTAKHLTWQEVLLLTAEIRYFALCFSI